MILIVLLIMVLLLGGIFFVFYLNGDTAKMDVVKKETTFAEWTEEEIFQNVPALLKEGIAFGEAEDYGDGNYVIGIEGSTLAYYQEYLKKLEEEGYVKLVDNGEKGLVDSVYTSTYAKDDLSLTITHVVNIDKTYVSACHDRKISEHMFYKDEYVAGITAEAKTTMYMLELYDWGNSFVYQLKNGHFIVEDGGMESEAPYLIDFLESLTPEGEKPIIEAWFISHAHDDHMGALRAITKSQTYSNRILVDGIYYCAANQSVNLEGGTVNQDEIVRLAGNVLQTSRGEKTPLYRPKTGERYFFCDITVDIVHCQEQLPVANYAGVRGWYNETSTVLMYTVEGQKILAGGDSDAGVMRTIMRVYDAEYLEVDVFTLLHHGINTVNMFTDFCSVNTALFTAWSTKGLNKNIGQIENSYLKEHVAEYYAWGKGTVALTFPYKVGEAEILPKNEWIYHGGRKFSYTNIMPETYDDNDSTTWK